MAHQDEHNISTPFRRASTFFVKGETIPADSKIVFDAATKSPHGKVIWKMARIIIRQDTAAGLEMDISIGTILTIRLPTMCADTTLENLTKKQPDLNGVPANLPMPYNIPFNPAGNSPSPYLRMVFDAVISDDQVDGHNDS
jgi:hypothetical protein